MTAAPGEGTRLPSALTSRLLVLAAAVLFSTGGAAIKATSLTSWQIAGFRSGVAVLALLAMVPSARRRLEPRAFPVAFAYAGALIFYVLANKLTTAANTIFLQSTAPLYILFLGPWLLKEPLRRRELVFMLMLALGLGMFFIGTEPATATAPQPLAGNLLAVAGGVFWALTMVGLRWIGKGPGDGVGPATTAVVAGNLVAVILCLPLAVPVAASTPVDWGIVAYLGVVQIGLAYVSLTAGIRRVPALEASLLLLLEPVLNPIWAWWVHGERPALWALLGGAVILASTALKTVVDVALRPRGRGRRSSAGPAGG